MISPPESSSSCKLKSSYKWGRFVASNMHTCSLPYTTTTSSVTHTCEGACVSSQCECTGAMQVLDISRPSYLPQSGQDGSILYCQCTDGRVQAHAVALKGSKCALSTKTVPGSKLLLNKPHVEAGLIVLDGGAAQVRTSAPAAGPPRHGICNFVRCPALVVCVRICTVVVSHCRPVSRIYRCWEGECRCWQKLGKHNRSMEA
jgi:hypothetical protein